MVDMRKQVIIPTIFFFLSILMLINVVAANPYNPGMKINPPSDAIPPTISINNPKNNTDYTSIFNITFSVARPICKNYVTYINEIKYTIDNQSTIIPQMDIFIDGYAQYNGSFFAPILATGNHSLVVEASGIGYQMFGNYFIIKGLSQVYFTTSDNSANGSDNLASYNKATLSTIFIVTIITLIVIVAVVGSVLLVFFKSRKSKTA